MSRNDLRRGSGVLRSSWIARLRHSALALHLLRLSRRHVPLCPAEALSAHVRRVTRRDREAVLEKLLLPADAGEGDGDSLPRPRRALRRCHVQRRVRRGADPSVAPGRVLHG